MDPNQNFSENPFNWSEFEHLDDFERFDQKLEELSIPDATYRQLKELNQALVQKAFQLASFESELEQKKSEFELARKNFERTRLQSSREWNENRLDKIIQRDRSHESPPSNDGQSDLTDFIPQSPEPDAVEFQSASLEPNPDFQNPEILVTDRSSTFQNEETPTKDQLTRFQHSAHALREKSEMISSVFAELDQMVHDLNRQQELLAEINLHHASPTANELNSVNSKLRRHFRKISNQIKST